MTEFAAKKEAKSNLEVRFPTFSTSKQTDQCTAKKTDMKLKNKNLNPKLNYKCIGYWKENHGHPIFGVSVNHHLDASSPTVFATVGYNRVTIYEAMAGGIKLLQVNSKESQKP